MRNSSFSSNFADSSSKSFVDIGRSGVELPAMVVESITIQFSVKCLNERGELSYRGWDLFRKLGGLF